jgi:hypothetical protein
MKAANLIARSGELGRVIYSITSGDHDIGRLALILIELDKFACLNQP